MSQRLSEMVTSGIRALSISSFCDSQSDSSGDGGSPGPQDPANPTPASTAAQPDAVELATRPATEQGSAQTQSQTQAPANPPKPTAAQPATQQGAARKEGRPSVGSSRRASFQTSASQLSRYESAASHIEQPEGKSQAGSATLPNYKYGKLQRDGEQWRKWIEDPNDTSCTIPSSQLTMDDLQALYTPGEANYDNVPPALLDQVVELGLPDEFSNPAEQSVYRTWLIDEDEMKWDGVMWDNMIVLVDIERIPDSDAPPMSEITLVLFKHLFDVDDLRHIFVYTVINPETVGFIQTQLYNEDNGLTWAVSQSDVDLEDPETWAHGTPEYDALLGTRIEKLISYIVLGGFERGTFRIAQVDTWPSWFLGARANMRFDIEPVSGSS